MGHDVKPLSTVEARENDWRWVTGEPGSYKNWGPGEPNDASGKENCTEICADDGARNDWAMPNNQNQKHRYAYLRMESIQGGVAYL